MRNVRFALMALFLVTPLGCDSEPRQERYCGDGIPETPEECDDGNNIDGDGCSADCKNEVTPQCGDSVPQLPEECDDGQNGDPCDGCLDDCTLHSNTCGDTYTCGTEGCDDGQNGDNCDGCLDDCSPHTNSCGDTYTCGTEGCDDGQNGDDCDGCLDDCSLHTSTCGDTYICGTEQCDDGAANAVDADCLPGCVRARCGDGHVNTAGTLYTEACDDGNDRLTDDCPDGPLGTCQLASCGDAFVNMLGPSQPIEQCDDGNHVDTDACSNSCTVNPFCGIDGVPDGNYLDPGEQCDLGPANSDITPGACPGVCRTNCLCPHCGDAVVDYILGEACDDGNTANGDGCSAVCAIEPVPVCGDGALDIDQGEQCDDGMHCEDGSTPCAVSSDCAGIGSGTCVPRNGDGCNDACQFEPVGQTCGDTIPDPLEKCDDGNLLNGDNCNPTCNLTNDVTTYLDMSSVCPGTPWRTGLLTVDDTHLWIACGGDRLVFRVDIPACDSSGACTPELVATLPANVHPEGITTDGNTIWLAAGADSIYGFDISAFTPGNPLTLGPQHIVMGGTGCGATQCQACGLSAGNMVMGCPANQFEIYDVRGVTYYNGYVYFLCSQLDMLMRLDPASGWATILAGDFRVGPAHVDGYGTAARFQSPRYMATDNSGMLYISDTRGCAIRSYNTHIGYVGTFAGMGPEPCSYADGNGINADIHRPRGMISDGTSLYWVEVDAHTIRQGVLATADVTTLAGDPCLPNPGSCPGTTDGIGSAARFDHPYDIVFHYPSNSLFVNDSAQMTIRRIQ